MSKKSRVSQLHSNRYAILAPHFPTQPKPSHPTQLMPGQPSQPKPSHLTQPKPGHPAQPKSDHSPRARRSHHPIVKPKGITTAELIAAHTSGLVIVRMLERGVTSAYRRQMASVDAKLRRDDLGVMRDYQKSLAQLVEASVLLHERSASGDAEAQRYLRPEILEAERSVLPF